MIKLLIDGKPTNLKTNWGEVDFNTFISLAECGNDMVQVASVLSGVPRETLDKSKFSEGLDHIFAAVNKLKGWPPIFRTPTKIGKYKVGLNIETFAQVQAMEEVIITCGTTKNFRFQQEALAEIAAIYCQGIDEPFDREKAGYLAKEFMTYPCSEVLTVGNYFMCKVVSLTKGIPFDSLRKDLKFVKEGFFARLWG